MKIWPVPRRSSVWKWLERANGHDFAKGMVGKAMTNRPFKHNERNVSAIAHALPSRTSVVVKSEIEVKLPENDVAEEGA